MAGPDADAVLALRDPVVRPVYVGFLDILGDPIRVTTAPYSLSFSNSGDTDLDGYTFSAVEPDFIGVGQITMKEGGAETVTVTLSGLIGIDTDLLNQIGNKANWQGRVARLWRLQMNEDLQQVGAIWPFFTAYMTVPTITGSKSSQTIQLDLESYLSFLTAPSNRTYLSQTDYDPGDLSAQASIAFANGTLSVGNTSASTYSSAAAARAAQARTQLA